MTSDVGHLLAGLGGGAVLAVLGVGLVLTHRSSGVLNFGHAAIALYLASAFFELRESGDVVLPVLGLPARVPVVERPTVLTAAIVTALLAAVLGAAVYVLLVRPLRTAGPVMRVAGTLGLFLYLQEVVRLRFPPSSAGATVRRRVLPDGSVEVFGATVGLNRLVLAAVAVVVGIVVGLLYGRTRFGLVSRAAADDELGAQLVGRSPVAAGAAAWALGSMLAGGIVVLAEPVIGLGPSTPLLVVPALAAALPGRLRSVRLAVVGGLGIGVVQSLIVGRAVTADWLPGWLSVTGLQEAIPAVVIIGVLLWRRDALLGRDGSRAQASRGAEPVAGQIGTSPAPRRPLLWTSLLTAAAATALATWSAPYRHALIVSMLFALVCLSVVVATGWGGQISFLPLAMAGIAGLTSLGAASAGAPFVLAALAGIAVATAGGWLLSAPLSRLRGVSLAVATLVVAVTIERSVLEGAAAGLAGREVPRPSIAGVDVGIGAVGQGNFRMEFGLLALAVLSAACLAVAALRRSQVGLVVLAAAADESAALAVGIDVESVRRRTLTLSCAVAGAAGVLIAYSVEAVSAQTFMVIGSVVALALTAVAGITRIAGALVAGALAQAGLFTTFTGRWFGSSAAGATYAVLGLCLMCTAVLAPSGVLGFHARRGARSRWAPAELPGGAQPMSVATGEVR